MAPVLGGGTPRGGVLYYGDTAPEPVPAVDHVVATRICLATRHKLDNPMSSENATPAPEIAPFGWYPDPAGTAMLRWWDGSAWTDRLEYRRPEVQAGVGYFDQAAS